LRFVQLVRILLHALPSRLYALTEISIVRVLAQRPPLLFANSPQPPVRPSNVSS
jgi:hypothetical protein